MAIRFFLGINIVAVAGSRTEAGKHKCLKDEGNICVFDFAYLQWPCLFLLPVDIRLQVLWLLIMNLLCYSPGCLGLWFWTKDASFLPLVIGMIVFWIKKTLVYLFFL